jgi:hypothetical protein
MCSNAEKKESLVFTLVSRPRGFLLRQSFYVENKTLAITTLAAGVILVIAAVLVFWKNFRE